MYLESFQNSYQILWNHGDVRWCKIQGVSFEILGFQMAVAQKWWIFDPMLVKPKCVWEGVVYIIWKIVNKQLKNVNNVFFFFSASLTP